MEVTMAEVNKEYSQLLEREQADLRAQLTARDAEVKRLKQSLKNPLREVIRAICTRCAEVHRDDTHEHDCSACPVLDHNIKTALGKLKLKTGLRAEVKELRKIIEDLRTAENKFTSAFAAALAAKEPHGN